MIAAASVMSSRSSTLDIEIIRESLIAVVNEMRANMIRASYSPIIYEGHDFSCCLMRGDGAQVALGRDDHPLHMLAVPVSTAAILADFVGDIEDGDVFLHNDPYTGGTHLNDMLMLRPVFVAGRLLFFAAVRSHWNDVGGMTPGSLSGRVTDIYQEGLRVQPTKVVARGTVNAPFIDLLLGNMRNAAERRGDFDAMLGVCAKAADRLVALAHKFGDRLDDAMGVMLARAERTMRDRIAELPDGEYRAEGFLESNGHTPEPLAIRLCLTIAGEARHRGLHRHFAADRRADQCRAGHGAELRVQRAEGVPRPDHADQPWRVCPRPRHRPRRQLHQRAPAGPLWRDGGGEVRHRQRGGRRAHADAGCRARR